MTVHCFPFWSISKKNISECEKTNLAQPKIIALFKYVDGKEICRYQLSQELDDYIYVGKFSALHVQRNSDIIGRTLVTLKDRSIDTY